MTSRAERVKSLRELFDHMRQGIVVFGPDGKVEGTHSRAAGEIFGDQKLEEIL